LYSAYILEFLFILSFLFFFSLSLSLSLSLFVSFKQDCDQGDWILSFKRLSPEPPNELSDLHHVRTTKTTAKLEGASLTLGIRKEERGVGEIGIQPNKFMAMTQ
jgi:hypothetical protein